MLVTTIANLQALRRSYDVTKVRLQKAIELLVRIEESIERIAETVGYATGFALPKAFKRIAGMSPQQYRLQATG